MLTCNEEGFSQHWIVVFGRLKFLFCVGKRNLKPLASSAAKPIAIIIAKSAIISRSICEIMFSVIRALINAMWLIRNGSIRTDPSWATTAVLRIAVMEVTVVKTKTNAEFSTWLQLSLFKEESSLTYLAKSLLEAVLL